MKNTTIKEIKSLLETLEEISTPLLPKGKNQDRGTTKAIQACINKYYELESEILPYYSKFDYSVMARLPGDYAYARESKTKMFIVLRAVRDLFTKEEEEKTKMGFSISQ